MSQYHIFKHFHTINKHRFHVRINMCHCGFPIHGLFHDLSKYGPTEFLPSAKYYVGTSSPIFKQRQNENLYSSVCVHHTNHNKHHFEYRIDIFRGDLLLKFMPFKYCIEYVCDVIAASQTYNGKTFTKEMPYDYFNKSMKYYLMHKGCKEYILKLFKIYKNEGFAGLKKKNTRKLYNEYTSKFPQIEKIPVYSRDNFIN